MSTLVSPLHRDDPSFKDGQVGWELLMVVMARSFEELGIRAGDTVVLMPGAPCRPGDIAMVRTDDGHEIRRLDGTARDVVGRVLLVKEL